MKRTIEVFTAGWVSCNDTLRLVKDAVRDCGCGAIEQKCSPGECSPETIVVDGVVVHEGRPTREWVEPCLNYDLLWQEHISGKKRTSDDLTPRSSLIYSSIKSTIQKNDGDILWTGTA